MVRKRKGFGQFFLHYPFPSVSRRNAHFPEKIDWHFLSNIDSEGNQICQKSMLQGHCLAEKVALYTALIVLYHDFNKVFLQLSHMACSEANYRNSLGGSSTA